jgi:sigma-E factor negative regulatory protein RseB
VRIGGEIAPREFRPMAEPIGKDWRRDAQPEEDVRPVSTGWSVSAPPPGFRLVHEIQRRFPGKPHAVSQLVFSDGLASLSVFVEPAGNTAPREALTQDGGLSIYTRPAGEHRVTVLGEVPPAAVQHVGRNLVRASVAPR